MATTAHTTTPRTDPLMTLNPASHASTSHPAATDSQLSTAEPDKSNLFPPLPSRQADSPIASLSPKSGSKDLTPVVSSLRLTGAAAMAEIKRRKQQTQQASQTSAHASRQTSPNPSHVAVQNLSGGGMSRPSDAPAPQSSEPLRQAAEKIAVPTTNVRVESAEVSPVSLGSFGTMESTGAGSSMTATAGGAHASGHNFVAEPAQMTDEPATFHENNGNLAVQDQGGNKAFSYPGPPPSQGADQGPAGGPARGMSLPGYGQKSPKSPASGKRHKCPYCETDFTRHHNLKSHLLTHSQEKPYVCQTCQSRFRRLHDLKRHAKLHTGERNHTCDKCGRKFARGDALARHNKGPGGCAGRRSSLGGDDDDGAEGMDGVEYETGGNGYDDGEGHGRRGSEPSRKRHQAETPDDQNRQVYRTHGSTYPPAPTRAMRESAGVMNPPTVIHPGSSSTTSPREMSNHPSPAGGSSMSSAYYGQGQVFAEPGTMTQSPKPLSPGQVPDSHRLSVGDGSAAGTGRNRSTSVTTQFQQHYFGRGSVGGGGRTSPHMSSQYAPNQQQQSGVSQPAMLPPLGSNHNQPLARIGLQQHAHPQPQQMSHVAPGTGPGSNPGSLSSHGRSSGSSMREIVGPEGHDLWAYIRQLEGRFDRMQSEYEIRIKNLQEELRNLRNNSSMGLGPGSYSSDIGPRY